MNQMITQTQTYLQLAKEGEQGETLYGVKRGRDVLWREEGHSDERAYSFCPDELRKAKYHAKMYGASLMRIEMAFSPMRLVNSQKIWEAKPR